MLLGTQDKDFFPEDILEKLEFVKSMGFQSFEIDGKLLVENVDKVKEAVEKTGVPVLTACNGYRGWIGDFIEERRLNGVEDLKEILRAVKKVEVLESWFLRPGECLPSVCRRWYLQEAMREM